MSEPEGRLALTPREIVSELDRYIIGQRDAKRAVAIAIRNRWRRQRLAEEIRDEVVPKNIILIGPTGVGKTEIARRLASLIRAPFIKVEATKYTQVGYVGRDVESIIRDLADTAHGLVKQEQTELQRERAEARAEDALLDALLPGSSAGATRDKMRERLRAGELDDREVEVELPQRPSSPNLQVLSGSGMGGMGFDLSQLLQGMGRGPGSKATLPIRVARERLIEREAEKLIDEEKVREEARVRAEQTGIVFIDEIDKVAAGAQRRGQADVSGEGVQRDLLPIVEGSVVHTRIGPVSTDHVLFIAAGAFHVAKPSDLIPELQGRFPIRVELSALSQADLRRILTEPDNALTRQYTLLLDTEGVTLELRDDAVTEIARIAEQVNATTENIGARRLHTIMEKLLEDWLFDAPDRRGQTLTVDADVVRARLEGILGDEDLTRFIL